MAFTHERRDAPAGLAGFNRAFSGRRPREGGAIDLCINKSLSGCAFDREEVRMPLDVWLAEGDDDDR